MCAMNFRVSVLVLSILLFPTTGYSDQNKIVVSGIAGAVNSDISLQVLKEAYKEIGYQIEYQPLPGARALHTSNSGQVDGELFRIANVEKKYKNLIPVPTPINVLQAIVFSKNKNVDVNGWKSLKPYKIGVQIGIKFVERGTRGFNVSAVETNEQVFKMLNSGRVNIAVVAYTNGVKTINKLKLTDVKTLKPPVQEYLLYHYLHKRHKNLIPSLDSVLQNMKKSGRIEQIRREIINKL